MSGDISDGWLDDGNGQCAQRSEIEIPYTWLAVEQRGQRSRGHKGGGCFLRQQVQSCDRFPPRAATAPNLATIESDRDLNVILRSYWRSKEHLALKRRVRPPAPGWQPPA